MSSGTGQQHVPPKQGAVTPAPSVPSETLVPVSASKREGAKSVLGELGPSKAIIASAINTLVFIGTSALVAQAVRLVSANTTAEAIGDAVFHVTIFGVSVLGSLKFGIDAIVQTFPSLRKRLGAE